MRKAGFIMTIFILSFFVSMTLYAAEDENDIYDSLKDSIQESWDTGFSELEARDDIKQEGPLMERLLRGIANTFYKNMVAIKGWSLVIGILSILIGIFIAVTAKLNKQLRKFAISFLIITVPCLLIFFVFGTAKLVSIFR